VKVTEIMSFPVITVPPEATVKHAAHLLVEYGISALPVLDPNGNLVGIVSEADLLPLEARADPRSQATPLRPTAGSVPQTVAEIMTNNVLSVSATAEVSQAARVMIEAGIKRVPVMHEGRLVGIVSRRDLVAVIARKDTDVAAELVSRLTEAGLVKSSSAVRVASGAAAIELKADPASRRVAESIALTVPGVLEVRFKTPALTLEQSPDGSAQEP
jgi:predicted transcriptional regulator